MATFVSGKDYLNICREFENIAQKDEDSRKKKEKLLKEDYEYTQRSIANAQSNKALTLRKFNAFTLGLKQSFITEALSRLVIESLDKLHTNEENRIC